MTVAGFFIVTPPLISDSPGSIDGRILFASGPTPRVVVVEVKVLAVVVVVVAVVMVVVTL